LVPSQGKLASPDRMLKSWAIYRYEGSGKLRYLGVISATGQDDALAKAIKERRRRQWLKSSLLPLSPPWRFLLRHPRSLRETCRWSEGCMCQSLAGVTTATLKGIETQEARSIPTKQCDLWMA